MRQRNRSRGRARSKPRSQPRTERVLAELAGGNALYEQRFGFTYIVCATGKSAEEMLAILNGVSPATGPPNCAKPPNSSGRLCRSDWESGWRNEQDHNACAGCSAGQAGRGHPCDDWKRRTQTPGSISPPARRMQTAVAAIWRRRLPPVSIASLSQVGRLLSADNGRTSIYSADHDHVSMRRHRALSLAAAPERQQLHHLSRKLSHGATG